MPPQLDLLAARPASSSHVSPRSLHRPSSTPRPSSASAHHHHASAPDHARQDPPPPSSTSPGRPPLRRQRHAPLSSFHRQAARPPRATTACSSTARMQPAPTRLSAISLTRARQAHLLSSDRK
jgi:hypothetical protein